MFGAHFFAEPFFAQINAFGSAPVVSTPPVWFLHRFDLDIRPEFGI